MKHKIQVPMVLGVFSIIALFLMAADCEKKEDKKDPGLTLELDKNTKATTSNFVTEQKKGGVKAGKADTKVYYAVGAPSNAKFFTFKGTTESKGKVTFMIQKVKIDGTLETAEKTLTDDVITAKKADVAKGTVYLQTGKAGFYYLTAVVLPEGDYKAGMAKVLLAVGEVPVPTGAVMFDGVAVTGDGITSGEAATKTNLKVDVAKKKIVITTIQDNKEFIVKVKVDYTKFPPNAPMYAPAYTYSGTNLGADKVVESAIKNGDNNVVLKEGDGANSATTEVKLALDKVTGKYAAMLATTIVSVSKQ